MGMSTRTSSRGGHFEINVTPLIDVLLVLLIIFLVMIPILTRMHTVDLPPTEDGAILEKPPVMIKLHADSTAVIDDGDRIMASDLAVRLRARVQAGSIVFVDFEDGVAWGDVIDTVDTVRSFADDPNHESIKVAVRIHEKE